MTVNTEELETLESQFAKDPGDIGVLRKLSSGYYLMGHFSSKTQHIYEKALMATPDDSRLSAALNVTVFIRQLRRFTVESAEPDLIDPEGLREALRLVQDYLKEMPNSPDLFAAMGDIHLLRGNALLAVGAYENAVKY